MAAEADVCVLVPTKNEAESIGEVVSGLRERGFADILVMDAGSTDGTREIAADLGARVEQQSGSGKGQAIREALGLIEAEYVLMLDGDGTYRPEDADAMLEPLLAGEAEHVVGDRFADIEPGAMPRLNRVGNRIISGAFRYIHGEDYGDILSGYRAFSLASVRRLRLTADGFGIETELAVECAKHDVPTAVVPITYRSRPAESDPNLRPVRDGGEIILTLYQLAKTNNPLFYFGTLGGASVLSGTAVALFVAFEWLVRDIPHQVLAVAAASAILFGVQLLMFGVLSDMILSLHREQMRHLE